MADEALKDLDQAIAKIKGMLPIFTAFSDMKSVLEFVSNNKGMIAGHNSEMQKMVKDKREMQTSLDVLRASIEMTLKKKDEIDSMYQTKLAEAQASYVRASTEARAKYIGERDKFIQEAEDAKRALGEERGRLQREISDLSRTLETLRAEYESLKVKFR